jgi:cyclohexa-1,5-dienecarbonyl-CoA hydratase
MACDRIVAHRDTLLGFPEIRVGCYPPVAVALLRHRAGHSRAVEMILSGENTSVGKLATCGIVDPITDDLDSALETEVRRYADMSPAVLGMTAKLLHDEARRTWGSRIAALEKTYLDDLLPHPDATEGVAAFIEKRQARWRDRET